MGPRPIPSFLILTHPAAPQSARSSGLRLAASTNAPWDPGWWCRIDGEVVARGAAIGLLEQESGIRAA